MPLTPQEKIKKEQEHQKYVAKRRIEILLGEMVCVIILIAGLVLLPSPPSILMAIGTGLVMLAGVSAYMKVSNRRKNEI